MARGQPLVEFTARKLRLLPAHFGPPSAVVSAPVSEVVDPGRAIVSAMGIEGFANVEFKRDERDDRYKLMEVNGRPNLSGALAVHCGVDFPLMTYHHLVAGVAPTAVEARHGVFWIEDGTDPKFVVGAWRRGELSLREALRPYTSRHVFSALAMDDPLLAVRRLGDRIARLHPRR
jgi:predicted ATP-grasp superfamily ATP-dependent carboligase